MMQRISRLLPLALLLVVSACFMETVTSKADPQANFAALHTYAWLLKKQSAPQDPRFDNDVVTAHVKRSANAVLAEKGYVLTGNPDPDFFVSFHFITSDISGDNQIPDYFGYFPIAWGGIGFYSSEVQEGTLIIDVIDAKTKKVIWRGVGERQVKQDGWPKQRLERIDSGVAKIMDQFPS